MKPDLLVLMPLRSEPSPQTALALAENMDGIDYRLLSVVGKPVDEARNELACRVAADGSLSGTLCIWIDDDCYWCAGSLKLMMETFAKHSFDVLTAYFGPRAPFSTPLCMLRPNDPSSAPRENRDFRFGEIVPIASASMNFAMHSASLLRDLGDEPFSPLPGSLGEDHSFFERVRLHGGRCALASGIVVAHCEDNLAFVPARRPFEVVANRLVPIDDGRTDAEIARDFKEKNVRRSYGPEIDKLCPEGR